LAARSFRVEIFQISIAAVLLEISYTRIFSYKLYPVGSRAGAVVREVWALSVSRVSPFVPV